MESSSLKLKTEVRIQKPEVADAYQTYSSHKKNL